jgi:hypothetical protein
MMQATIKIFISLGVKCHAWLEMTLASWIADHNEEMTRPQVAAAAVVEVEAAADLFPVVAMLQLII